MTNDNDEPVILPFREKNTSDETSHLTQSKLNGKPEIERLNLEITYRQNHIGKIRDEKYRNFSDVDLRGEQQLVYSQLYGPPFYT